MTSAVITLEKLLANKGALLSFGLKLPTNFFINPAWEEMIYETEKGQISLHPLGKSCKEEFGKPIALPKTLTFHQEDSTLVSEDKSVVVKNKNGQLYIETEYYDGKCFHGTQIILGQEKEYFRAEVFSYEMPLFARAPFITFTGERSTSYFDEYGIEVKRDRAYSVEKINVQGICFREQLLVLLRNAAICKDYVSTIDQSYSLKDKSNLPNGSFITKMTYHRDEKRPDIAWIGPKEDKICIRLAKCKLTRRGKRRSNHLSDTKYYMAQTDARLIMRDGNWVSPTMPRELDENSIEQFIDAASGGIETKIALAKAFGEKGKPWLVKHEIILNKEKKY